MHNKTGWWIVIGVLLLLDLYVFQVVKALTAGSSEKTKMIIYTSYWVVSFTAVVFLIILPYWTSETWPKTFRNYFFAFVVGLFIAKLIGAIFFLIDDIRRGFSWLICKVFSSTNPDIEGNGWNLSRSAFLSWMGITIGGAFFGTLMYGFSNKYNYKLRTVRMKFPNLPEGFRGIKIIQVSDIHSGSFTDKEAVAKGVDMILKQKPDLILFTGDLVNDHAGEMANYKDLFARLQAPMGVYSILGNHDYGDYMSWPSEQAKRQNLENLKGVHREMGWRLLLDEHVELERKEDKIALLGVQNWSARASFPKYGRLDEAYKGSEKYPFKLLMSHDPTHWDGEVVPKYRDIDLMLAGHTHGMQFGVETPFMKWSPVQWVYKQWAGLYETDRQKLYVNRGYGFIGYPGRVGILPEITLLELS